MGNVSSISFTHGKCLVFPSNGQNVSSISLTQRNGSSISPTQANISSISLTQRECLQHFPHTGECLQHFPHTEECLQHFPHTGGMSLAFPSHRGNVRAFPRIHHSRCWRKCPSEGVNEQLKNNPRGKETHKADKKYRKNRGIVYMRQFLLSGE